MIKAWKAFIALLTGSNIAVAKTIDDESTESEKTHLDPDINTEIITTFSVGTETISHCIETLDSTHHKE